MRKYYYGVLRRYVSQNLNIVAITGTLFNLRVLLEATSTTRLTLRMCHGCYYGQLCT